MIKAYYGGTNRHHWVSIKNTETEIFEETKGVICGTNIEVIVYKVDPPTRILIRSEWAILRIHSKGGR